MGLICILNTFIGECVGYCLSISVASSVCSLDCITVGLTFGRGTWPSSVGSTRRNGLSHQFVASVALVLHVVADQVAPSPLHQATVLGSPCAGTLYFCRGKQKEAKSSSMKHGRDESIDCQVLEWWTRLLVPFHWHCSLACVGIIRTWCRNGWTPSILWFVFTEITRINTSQCRTAFNCLTALFCSTRLPSQNSLYWWCLIANLLAKFVKLLLAR